MTEGTPNHALSDLFSSEALSNGSPSAAMIRNACIEELKVHYSWYERSKSRHAAIWGTVTVITIALSAATTVAIAFGATGTDGGKLTFAILSALGSALSSLLAVFASRDTWQLRESGRIAIDDLVSQACLIPDNDQKKALAQAVALFGEAHKIEEMQAKGFFGLLSQQADQKERKRRAAKAAGDKRSRPDQRTDK